MLSPLSPSASISDHIFHLDEGHLSQVFPVKMLTLLGIHLSNPNKKNPMAYDISSHRWYSLDQVLITNKNIINYY